MKKSKQLNEKTANIVAIDTTGISLSYAHVLFCVFQLKNYMM